MGSGGEPITVLASTRPEPAVGVPTSSPDGSRAEWTIRRSKGPAQDELGRRQRSWLQPDGGEAAWFRGPVAARERVRCKPQSTSTMRAMVFGTVLAMGTCLHMVRAALGTTCEHADNVRFVQAKDHCLAIRTFLAREAAEELVVILHGDLWRGGAVDQMFPLGMAVAHRGVSTVVMIRPGYSGGGGRSSGRATRNQRHHERYSTGEIDSIATAVAELKSYHNAKRLVLVGYGGGAIIAGMMLGRHSDLVDGVVLVACPCDVPRWRSARGLKPLPAAESPHEWLDEAAADARIIAITARRDRLTHWRLAKEYVAAAQARGLKANFARVTGARHGSGRLRSVVLSALGRILVH